VRRREGDPIPRVPLQKNIDHIFERERAPAPITQRPNLQFAISTPPRAFRITESQSRRCWRPSHRKLRRRPPDRFTVDAGTAACVGHAHDRGLAPFDIRERDLDCHRETERIAAHQRAVHVSCVCDRRPVNHGSCPKADSWRTGAVDYDLRAAAASFCREGRSPRWDDSEGAGKQGSTVRPLRIPISRGIY
jgi:hypothetical protein